MKYLLIFIIALFLVYYTLFTPSGNKVITPLLKEYVSKHSSKNFKIELINFSLSGSFLKANFVINETITAKIYGEIAPMDASFNLNYNIYASTLKVKSFITKQKIEIAGKMKGEVDKFNVTGEGKALNSDIVYSFNVIDKIIKNLLFNIKNASVKNLLYLAQIKPYADGKFDLTLDIPDLNVKSLNGFVDFTIDNGKIDSRLVYNDFNLTLPKSFLYKLKTASRLRENIVTLICNFKTSLGNIFFHDAKVYIDTKEFSSNYDLNISDLSVWQEILKRDLQGRLDVYGDISYKNLSFSLSAVTKSFGGKVESLIQDKQLYTTFEKVPIKNLFYILKYPRVFDGQAWGNAEYNFLSYNGKLNALIQNTRFLSSQMTKIVKKYVGSDLTKERFKDTIFEAVLNKNEIICNLIAKNNNSYILIEDAHIYKPSNNVEAKFKIDIYDNNFSGKITGNVANPKLELDTLKYLKNEFNKIIDKTIDKDTKKKIDETLEDLGIKKFMQIMF